MDEDLPSLSTSGDQQDQDYLAEHAAFDWLIHRITVAMALESDMKTDQTVRSALLECIGSRRRFSLRLQWDLRDFFESQYEDAEHVELSSVICICGTVSNAQAVSVGEYVDMVWPDLGSTVLKAISAALRSVSGRHKGE